MTSMQRKLVKLHPARAREAAETLARAFMNDPLQAYTFPDLVERAELGVILFEAVVRYALLAGDVWVTEGNIDAVGVWRPPEEMEYRPEIDEASGFSRLPETIGADPFHRFMSVIEHLEVLHRRDMPAPHWYAMVLGVDPASQGRGLGRLVLSTVFDIADAQRVPCYLETAHPANVGFYTRAGFQLLVEGVEPQAGLRYWTFRRDPEPIER